jgi:hypothetical protein
VSDKGGNETDYVNLGYKNEQGDFVKYAQGGEIVRDRGEGHFIYIRYMQDAKGTGGSWIGIDKEGKVVQGYGLEPRGPSTAKANQGQRIVEGDYNLILSRERAKVDANGLSFPNRYVLFNKQVPQWRGITIHGGQFYDQTRGCIIPGLSLGIGKRGQEDMNSKREGYLRVFDEEKVKIEELERFIRGGTNVSAEEARARAARLKFRIFNAIPKDK